MVSSFSQTRSTQACNTQTHSRQSRVPNNSPNGSKRNSRQPSSTLIGIDTLAQLPGPIALPPVSSSEPFISQKHEVKPALALNLLNDIQSVVSSWQEQLRQIVTSMNAIQAQGPMVEGWLECCTQQTSAHTLQQGAAQHPDQAAAITAEMALLRHGDTDALMRYVDALDARPAQPPVIDLNAHNSFSSGTTPTTNSASQPSVGQPSVSQTAEPSAHYRLCNLDASGKVSSRPCPADQMGMVSLAIARHQKFKQLFHQKQTIEAKLQKAIDQLTGVRGTLHHLD